MTDEETVEQVRHEIFDKAVMVSTGSLINTAEMIFSLRDLNRSMEIIISFDRPGKPTNRLLGQPLLHRCRDANYDAQTAAKDVARGGIATAY